jgi:hypothetical protein
MLNFNTFCENFDADVDVLALESIPKSRFINELELWDKFEQVCKRNNVIPLTIQLRAALKRLKSAGLITFKRNQGVRKC